MRRNHRRGKTESAIDRAKEWLRNHDGDDLDIMLTQGRADAEWQCIECGFVVESQHRPGYCPECNCINGDRPVGVKLFIPREACGWFE